MTPITKGRVSALLAATKCNFSVSFKNCLYRSEFTPLVTAITKRLIAAFATSTPEISACFYFHNIGRLLGSFRFCSHDGFLLKVKLVNSIFLSFSGAKVRGKNNAQTVSEVGKAFFTPTTGADVKFFVIYPLAFPIV